MQETYDELIAYILKSGKRIAKRAGNIEDLPSKEDYLTEEDLIIERGLKEIILKRHPSHYFYAEEEHDDFPDEECVWIADPISATGTFVKGLPHYAITLAYTISNEPVFAVVYDPSVDELFTAYKGKGAFLNGKEISISSTHTNIAFSLSLGWKDEKSINDLMDKLSSFSLNRNKNSFGVNLSYIACGRYDGLILFGKDTFPMYPGALIIREAGGIITNAKGESFFKHTDRAFIAGNIKTYDELFSLLSQVSLPPS